MSADETLRLLADPTRAQIVEFLADEALCTCHLVAELDAKQTNISNHLRALRRAGLVVAEPAGRFTWYRLAPETLETAASRLARLAARARITAHTGARREC